MEIQDYPNYLIYEDGRVYNNKYNRFIKPTMNHGYKYVELCNKGLRKRIRLHRLIASHYIPNPENKLEVDHIDRDRLNNNINNLRWVTHTQNQQNINTQKNNELGEQFISNYKNRYRFSKTIKGHTHQKYFKTLDEAIEYKKQFFRNND